MRCVLVVLVLLVTIVGGSVAHAEPPLRKPTLPAALEHYSLGARLYNVQSFQEAANAYKASALVEPSPATEYNLGQCYRMLGEASARESDLQRQRDQYAKAIWHYERFIKTSPETPERITTVKGWIDDMQKDLASAPPLPTSQNESRTPSHWYGDGVGWGLTGGGVAMLGVAGALFLNAASLRDDADRTPDQQEQASLRDKAETRSLVGLTLAIVGSGLAITGAVKLAVHSDATTDDARHGWGVSVSPRSIVVFGRF